MKIDQIIRSRRRTFSLEIRPDGQLVVRAPYVATDAQIQKLVDHKTEWIKKNRAKVKRRYGELQPKTFSPGERFWYLGEQYPLELTFRKRPLLDLDGAFLLSMDAKTKAKETFIAWYRKETRRITRDLITKYVARHGFKVNAVRITAARTRWGSCSGQKNLNFTYRLSMAPIECDRIRSRSRAGAPQGPQSRQRFLARGSCPQTGFSEGSYLAQRTWRSVDPRMTSRVNPIITSHKSLHHGF